MCPSDLVFEIFFMDKGLDRQSKISPKKKCFISHSLHPSCSRSPSFLLQVFQQATFWPPQGINQQWNISEAGCWAHVWGKSLSYYLSLSFLQIWKHFSAGFSLSLTFLCPFLFSLSISLCSAVTYAQEVNDSHCQQEKSSSKPWSNSESLTRCP